MGDLLEQDSLWCSWAAVLLEVGTHKGSTCQNKAAPQARAPEWWTEGPPFCRCCLAIFAPEPFALQFPGNEQALSLCLSLQGPVSSLRWPWYQGKWEEPAPLKGTGRDAFKSPGTWKAAAASPGNLLEMQILSLPQASWIRNSGKGPRYVCLQALQKILLPNKVQEPLI